MKFIVNEQIRELVDNLKAYKEGNDQRGYIRTISLLVDAIENKDNYTARHTERVTLFSMILFDELFKNKDKYQCELHKEQRAVLKKAALLHDLGKVGIRTEVLNKPGRLTDEEFEEIKHHSEYGYQIASFLNEDTAVLEAIRFHHERYDGKGYPQGLAKDDIPFLSAIIAVADTYDAMTSDRPYRKGLDRSIAREEILKYSGSQFNPIVVKAFIAVYDQNIL